MNRMRTMVTTLTICAGALGLVAPPAFAQDAPAQEQGRTDERGVTPAQFAAFLAASALQGAAAAPAAQDVRRGPFVSQAIPGDPKNTLTSLIVEVPPGAKSGSHHHAGTVFAYVLEGTLKSQLDNGKLVEYRAGQSWMEVPGTQHTFMENPSATVPARLLAIFVAPTGATLTTPDK